MSIQLIKSDLGQLNWSYLHQLYIESAYSKFTEHLNYFMLSFSTEKTGITKAKFVIRNEWMIRSLIKSSITANKLYRQCISKPNAHSDYTHYAKHRNMYNK